MKKENICDECGEEKEIETYILEKYGFRVCEAWLVINKPRTKIPKSFFIY